MKYNKHYRSTRYSAIHFSQKGILDRWNGSWRLIHVLLNVDRTGVSYAATRYLYLSLINSLHISSTKYFALHATFANVQLHFHKYLNLHYSWKELPLFFSLSVANKTWQLLGDIEYSDHRNGKYESKSAATRNNRQFTVCTRQIKLPRLQFTQPASKTLKT